MTSYASNIASEAPRLDAYGRAERALWERYGIAPRERFVDIPSSGGHARALDIGSGRPVLFVHGTVGPGAWASLIAELRDMRSIVLERPGWNESSAIDFANVDYGACAADVLRDVLDGLGLDSADVVGGSIGNVWALRLAERHPSRVRRVVLTGGGPIVPQVGVPGFIKLMASPLGAVLVRMSGKPRAVRKILRASGHGASLDSGRIPDVFVEWRAAVTRETASMRHERAMVRAVVSRNGYRADLTLTEHELSAIVKPVLHVFGTADAVGAVELWREVADVLPHGRLEMIEGAGHMPWFDDVEAVAGSIRRFLREDELETDER